MADHIVEMGGEAVEDEEGSHKQVLRHVREGSSKSGDVAEVGFCLVAYCIPWLASKNL